MWPPVLIACLIVGVMYAFRTDRPSRLLRQETDIVDRVFAATRREDLDFVGHRARVIFQDMRLDRWAPGDFYDTRSPVSAVRIAVNATGQHFLWAYSDTLQPTPLVTRLTETEAAQALRDSAGLLERTYPRSEIRAAGRPSPKRLRGS